MIRDDALRHVPDANSANVEALGCARSSLPKLSRAASDMTVAGEPLIARNARV